MGISYKKLWILLIEKDILPAKLRKELDRVRQEKAIQRGGIEKKILLKEVIEE